uniref:MLLT10 histone lysine methyltransferase DOT1L cofactor n=1 Tax=Tetraodon nigroviridis TaxID=99883 RepID=H3CRT5_TETNG
SCYGIVQVPTGPWFCRKCESQERAPRVRCELCPHKDGALKRTDNGGWAHVVCALYIPEVEFANVSTMEPIVLQSVPHDRYNKTCYICEDQGRESKAATGACMTCNKHGCRQAFHVTCAQFAGLLCEEQGSDADNVKYCGYCKYHHSKLRRSRGRGSRSQSLSDSSSHCMDRPPDEEKKKHKERERHKPKHKKTMDMSPSLVLPNIMIPDKTYNSSGSAGGGVPAIPASSQKRLDDGGARFTSANFQEVSSSLSGSSSKDTLSADAGKAVAELKNKKSGGGGHAAGQRGGRKSLTSSGKALSSAGVTMATPTSASASTGPFHQASSSEFLGFSDSSLRPGGGTTFSSPPSFSSCLPKPSSEGSASEGSAPLFGSLMSVTTASAGIRAMGGKLYENSHSHSATEMTSHSGSAGYKRPQSSSSGPGMGGVAAGGEDGAKKKKKGNWRNRYGPCFTTDVKPSEASPSLSLPTSSTANTCSSTASPSSAKSPSLLRNGSLQSSSGPTATGVNSLFSCGFEFSGVCHSSWFSVNINALIFSLYNSNVWQHLLASLGSSSSPTSSAPDMHHSGDRGKDGGGIRPVCVCVCSPRACVLRVSGLSGSVFNLAPSHMFGNRLNSNATMAALMAQSEASPADQEVGDSGVGAQGFSVRASPKTTPRSPICGLHIPYHSSGSFPGPGFLWTGGSGEMMPPVATSIEQLLERQWNEGQSFLMQQGAQGDVVGMLKTLHQLQEENRRLEEQIKTLTMKKERLQLLSAQLSVPFTPSTTSAGEHTRFLSLLHTAHFISHVNTHVSIRSKLSSSSRTARCADGHSSGGSTSSLSTPPSVSQSPPQPQLNGGAALPAVAPAGLGRVAGLMGALGAAGSLGIGGMVGALNGVIQAPAGASSPLATGLTLPVNRCVPTAAGAGARSVRSACLGLLEQQRLLQRHQIQQLLQSQPSAEQQQAFYQLMQQQQDLQQLHSHVPSQLPINNLLPGSQSKGQGAIAANPFLALQHTHAETHAASGAQKPRLAEKAVGVAGQEKT